MISSASKPVYVLDFSTSSTSTLASANLNAIGYVRNTLNTLKSVALAHWDVFSPSSTTATSKIKPPP